MGVVMIMMMFFIPTFSESDSAPTAKVGMTDFSINEVGNKIGTNQFRVYRSDVITPINLDSSIAFNSKVENVRMDMQCFTQEGEFVDLIEDKGGRYEFSSIPQTTLDIEITWKGYAHLDCDRVCSKEKTTFILKNLFNEKREYRIISKIAEMNTGESSGTKVLYVERRKPIGINIGFGLRGEDSTTINCNIYITTENPSQNIKKSFTIEYIAKDIECKDYTELGNYIHGEIIVEFTQDVTKEQVESLLSSYNLPSDQIEFPEMFDFRVDFEGDEEGFVDFLEQHEFIKTSNPNIFEVRSFEYIKCEEAKKIFRSYPDIFIDYIHCFERVEGIVKVPEGEEDKWICELKKNDIVINANLNKLGSIAD